MAGNRHGQRIRGASSRDCAHGLRRTDAFGNIAIADGDANGNLSQRLPDTLLERGAAHIQRQVQTDPRRFDKAHHLRDQTLETGIAANQFGVCETILQIARQGIRIVAQRNGADAAIALRDQDGAERALAHGKADARVRAAGAIARGSHAEHVGGFFVEARIGVVTGVIDRVSHRAATLQFLAHTLAAMRVRVLFWRHSGDRLEHAMKMERAHAGACGQGFQTRRGFAHLNQPARRRHLHGVLLDQGRLIRFAAFARPESSLFGLGAGAVKANIFRTRQTRSAGRPAIHTRRRHRIPEAVVGVAIASHDCGPAWIVFRRRGALCFLVGRIHECSLSQGYVLMRANVTGCRLGRYTTLAVEFARFNRHSSASATAERKAQSLRSRCGQVEYGGGAGIEPATLAV